MLQIQPLGATASTSICLGIGPWSLATPARAPGDECQSLTAALEQGGQEG